MENFVHVISQVLGITILHSLWQGLLIFLVLRILFLCRPALSSVKKYNLSLLALLSISLWFAYTLYAEAQIYNWNSLSRATPSSMSISEPKLLTEVSVTAVTDAPVRHAFFDVHKSPLYYTLKKYLPYISVFYAIGLVINFINLLLAWNKIRLIKQNLIAAEQLQEYIINFSRKLRIRKYIQVHFTQLVDVPCIIGYFKPILLLPVTLTTQLSEEEIEAILLHELAHIKSNDYLLNIVQHMITILLFFNPFVLFINRIISMERENRCDDIVVRTIRHPLTYAQALLKLEENRQTGLRLALAATGKKYSLLNRIERIMKAKKPMINTRHLALAVIILIGSLLSISWLNPEIRNGKIVSRNAAKAINRLTSIIIKANTENRESADFNYPDQKESESIVKIKETLETIEETGDNAPGNIPDQELNQENMPSIKISAVNGLENLGRNPMVMIDGKKYEPETLYRISGKSFDSVSVVSPQKALAKYGSDAGDGAVEIRTKNGEIIPLSYSEKTHIVIDRILGQPRGTRKFYTRLPIQAGDYGSSEKTPYPLDVIMICPPSGGTMMSAIRRGAKAIFVMGEDLYEEDIIVRMEQAEIRSLLLEKYGGGTYGAGDVSRINKSHPFESDLLKFDLSGHEVYFKFLKEPEETRARRRELALSINIP